MEIIPFNKPEESRDEGSLPRRSFLKKAGVGFVGMLLGGNALAGTEGIESDWTMQLLEDEASRIDGINLYAIAQSLNGGGALATFRKEILEPLVGSSNMDTSEIRAAIKQRILKTTDPDLQEIKEAFKAKLQEKETITAERATAADNRTEAEREKEELKEQLENSTLDELPDAQFIEFIRQKLIEKKKISDIDFEAGDKFERTYTPDEQKIFKGAVHQKAKYIWGIDEARRILDSLEGKSSPRTKGDRERDGGWTENTQKRGAGSAYGRTCGEALGKLYELLQW